MVGSEIYSDFSSNILWIREQVREDIKNLPPRLRQMGKLIASERLFIVPDGVHVPLIDSKLGRPVPYCLFWFADALGSSDESKVNSLALAMVYSVMSITLRDDITDSKELMGERLHLHELSNIFQRKYIDIFKSTFEKRSSIWRYLAQALDEQLRYESWNKAFDLKMCRNPFSAHFIEDSSRYFYAVTMPSMVAIALLADAETKAARIARFSRHLSMGARIHDDLMDCQNDLAMGNMNHSCVLLHARQWMGKGKGLNEETLANLFLSEGFVRSVYDPIIFYLNKAKEDILPFDSNYLTKFMDEHMDFIVWARDATLERQGHFFDCLGSLLRSCSRA